MSFFILPGFVQAKYSGGSGTAGDPYRISSAADLLALAANTNDYDKHFILIADINLSPYSFTTALVAPDSLNTTTDFDGIAFTGVFDGNSHTISNLTTDSNGAGNSYLGLFGYIGSDGEINNLGLEDVNIIGGDDSGNLGVLAGQNYGTISNCYSTGSVSGGDNSQNLGGLTGINYGDVNNCYSSGTVTGGVSSDDLGGLVGDNHEGSISNCYSSDDVTGELNSMYAGGLVGRIWGGSVNNCYSTGAVTGGGDLGGLVGYSYGSISNCYSTGTVTGGVNSFPFGGLVGGNRGNISNCYSTGNVIGQLGSKYLGGLVGYNQWGIISDCYSTGAVTGGKGSSNLGGLAGYNNLGDINNCYFLVTSGPNNGSGTPLTDIQMKHQASFIGWDFDIIWTITEGINYPKLVSQTDCDLPSAPTGISASNGIYTDHVRVTWSSVSGATGYEVWRSTRYSSGSASKLGDYTSPFDDSSVTVGTMYHYWVKAKNDCGTSDFNSSDRGYASTDPNYSVLITKCAVTAGSKDNSDKISFSGTMDANADDFNDADTIEVTIDSNDIVNPCVLNFPIDANTFKNGKYSYSKTAGGIKKSFTYDVKTGKFTFAAANADLSGLVCPLTVRIEINSYVGAAEVNETVVNGPKKPIPINLMMGVKDVLRVDKCTVKQNNKKPNSDQLSVKGAFTVEDTDVNMVNEEFAVTLGAQTFTLPVGSFKANKGGFTCTKAGATEGGTAAATFNFNSCAFTLTIKNANITAASGDTVNFGAAFADFNEVEQVTLP